MGLGSIQPGDYKSQKFNYIDYIESNISTGIETWEGYYSTFNITEPTNLFAQLQNLPFDLDLYLGRINPETGQPQAWGNGAPIIFNSSTNPNQNDESIFAQLNGGQYWLGLDINSVEPTDEQAAKEFEIILDGATFDETTKLSNDPLLTKQWHLFNTGISGGDMISDSSQWIASPNADIRAPEGWQLDTDASEIIIAIIDSGIDTKHPDLRSNLWVNPNEIANNDNDDDNNEKKDDIHGWNFVTDSPNILPAYHGTHVAGIAGAQGDNQAGISGIAWDTQLMCLDVFNGEKSASIENITNAINYAVANGAKVINMSLGANEKIQLENITSTEEYAAYQTAFEYAYANDVFIAIAAGNEGAEYYNRNYWQNIGNFDLYPSAPAAWSKVFGNIASVASTNAQDLRSSYSNYGQSITISAPGGDGASVIVGSIGDQQYTSIYAEDSATEILSTVPTGTGEIEDDYSYSRGTSMASPVVAGMAALIRAQDASITATETLAILRAGSSKNARLTSYVNQGYQADLYDSLRIAQNWQGPDSLTQIGQDDAPVVNLTALTTAQTLTGSLTLERDADNDSLIGFYRVLDAEGSVLDPLGNLIKPGDSNYQFVALNPANLVDPLTNLGVKDGTSTSKDYILPGASNGFYLAPYAITGDDTWFAWHKANSDGLDHFTVLGPNRFGFEDQAGKEADADFNDMVLSFASQEIL